MGADPEQHRQSVNLRRRYQIGSSSLEVRFGDITESRAEVLVSSDDYTLSMGGGVSRAIRNAGGTAIAIDAAKAGFRQLGDVVVTSAGALDARYVFHVVTIGPVVPRHGAPRWDPALSTAPMDMEVHRDEELAMHRELVERATARVFDLARAVDARSIAFPALGAGVAGIPMEAVAEGMTTTIARYLSSSLEPVDVELWLSAKSWQSEFDYIVFFERIAAALASIAMSREAAVDDRSPRPSAPEVVQAERERMRVEAELARADSDDQRQKIAEEYAQTVQHVESALADRATPLNLFVSYSRRDKDEAIALMNHLSSLKHSGLAVWSDRIIEAGEDWEAEIHEALEAADIGLYLLSADFLASEYCVGREWKRALERQAAGEMVVVPVILRACDWQAFVGQLQALPQDARPIMSDRSRIDESMLEVVQGVRARIESIKRQRRTTPA